MRKNRVGIAFGTSPSADIVLPKRNSLLGLAIYQCALTFDDKLRIILRDVQDHLSEGRGALVTHNVEGGEKRRGFT